jgi:hypothetical protein
MTASSSAHFQSPLRTFLWLTRCCTTAAATVDGCWQATNCVQSWQPHHPHLPFCHARAVRVARGVGVTAESVRHLHEQACSHCCRGHDRAAEALQRTRNQSKHRHGAHHRQLEHHCHPPVVAQGRSAVIQRLFVYDTLPQSQTQSIAPMVCHGMCNYSLT